jgi:SAM-dependent methyltransferase
MQPDTTQRWSPESYARNARFVSDLGEPLLDLLDPRPGETILDLGCGDGALTLRLRDRGATIVGVDASPEFVAAARAQGLDAHLGDAQQLAFEGAFDAVFSNAALHWMRDHPAVLAGVFRSLRPGGRFVAELGGQGNVAAIVVALGAVLAQRGVDVRTVLPWRFPTVAEFRAQLETAGFVVETIALHPRPTPLPTDMRGWLATFAGPFFAPLAPAERPRAIDETIALLAPALQDRSGAWVADYVRLRFRAVRPVSSARW